MTEASLHTASPLDEGISQNIQIPVYLQHWLAELGWLEPELMGHVAALAQRIDVMFSNFFSRSSKGNEEPDGYDGIERKGHLDRLLLSEWMLMNEVPGEFIRRTVMGELLFLKPYQTSPKKSKQVTLLIDASPLQWGSPRLMHLVILVVLNRYAQKHGGVLRWSFLHTLGHNWCIGIERELVRKWQNAHTEDIVTDQVVNQWLLRLGIEALEEKNVSKQPKGKHNAEIESELWVLGSPAVRSFFDGWQGIHFLVCDEPLESEYENSLRLGMQLNQREQSVYLPLPPDPIQIQILRNPLRTLYLKPIVASAKSSDLKSQFWQTQVQFYAHGNALMVRYPFERLMIFPDGSSGYFTPKKLMQQNQTVIGAQAGVKKIELALLCHMSGDLRLVWQGHKFRHVPHEYITWIDRESTSIDKKAQKLVLKRSGWHACFSLSDDVYLVDAAKQFWRISVKGEPHLLCENVIHIDFHHSKQEFSIINLQGFEAVFKTFMQISPKSWEWGTVQAFANFHNPLKDPLPPQFEVRVSYDKDDFQPKAVAWKCREKKWRVRTLKETFYLSIENTVYVVGLSSHEVFKNQPAGLLVTGLLIFDQSRTQLKFVHQYGEVVVADLEEKVVAWDYYPQTTLLTMLFVSGKLVMCNLNSGQITFQIDILSQEKHPKVGFLGVLPGFKGIADVKK